MAEDSAVNYWEVITISLFFTARIAHNDCRNTATLHSTRIKRPCLRPANYAFGLSSRIRARRRPRRRTRRRRNKAWSTAASRSPSAGTRTAFRRSSSATSSGVRAPPPPPSRPIPPSYRGRAPQVAVWLSLYHCFSPSLYLSRCVRCLFSPVCVLSLSYLSISSAPRSERKRL